MKLEEKPLHLMTTPELEAERSYREGLRHAYDGDDHKMHRSLQHRVDEVNNFLNAALKGEKYDPEKQ